MEKAPVFEEQLLERKGLIMKYDLSVRNGKVVFGESVQDLEIGVKNGIIEYIGEPTGLDAAETVDAVGKIIFPGVVDTHVHFREPGPIEEEDFLTGTRSAAAGGVTSIFEHPVDVPPTTTRERFIEKRDGLAAKAYVDYGLWGGVVPGNLDQIQPMWEEGACAFKAFLCSSDPNYPMIREGVLVKALQAVKKLDSMLAVHAENDDVIKEISNGLESVTDVRQHEFIRPEYAEEEAIRRAVFLAEQADAHLHILHLSSARGAAFVRERQKAGSNVTAETCTHYLALDENDIARMGVFAIANPPVRGGGNKDRLFEELRRGTITSIISDHSPCTWEEKLRGSGDIRKLVPGINSLQLGLVLMIDELVKSGKASYNDLARWMCEGPARLMNAFPKKGSLKPGADADFVLIDPDHEWTLKKEDLFTKNNWTAFEGHKFTTSVQSVYLRGKKIYEDQSFPMGSGYGKFLPGAGRKN